MKTKLLTLAIIILFMSSTYGQKNEISMLNDRFSCNFPDSAKIEERGTDILSDDDNTNVETKVFYKIGTKKIVFLAQDLLLKSIKDLENKLKLESSLKNPFLIKKKDNLDSTICYELTPQKFNKSDDAILIKSIIIQNSDNTLSKLSAFLNPSAFKDKATFDKIVEKTFTSFKKGNRKLNLSARTETFKILETKTTYNIQLPENYIIKIEKKHDFDVLKIMQIYPYGENDFAELFIYFGFDPPLLYKELKLENFRTEDTNGQYILQNLTWTNYKDTKRNLYLREQIFEDNDIQKNAQTLIAMIAHTEKRIEDLALIVKNSMLKYDK